MNTPFFSRDNDFPHRGLRTTRDDPEPHLADLLEDSVLQILMRRDGVERADLEALIRRVRRKLDGAQRRPGDDGAAQFAASLYAECLA